MTNIKVFCAKCSSKTCLLPKFGIEREVRVCDACFDKYGPKDENDSPQHQPKQVTTSGSNLFWKLEVECKRL